MKKNKPAKTESKISKSPTERVTVNAAVTNKLTEKSDVKKYWLLMLIPLCAFLIYGKTLDYPLDKLDEKPIFSNIQVFTNNHSSIFESIYYDAFFGVVQPDVFFYRPLQNVSYLIDFTYWGNNPFGYHLMNLMLFIGISLLLFYLLTLFNIDFYLAFIMALLFSSHPLFSTAVVWLPSRGDLLSGFFSMLSFVCFVNYGRGAKKSFLLISIVSFFLGVFSKESVVGLPVLFVGYLFIADGLPLSKEKIILRLGKNKAALIPLFAISAFYILARQILQQKITIVPGNSFSFTHLLTNLRTIPETIGKELIPMSLSPMPTFSLFLTSIGCIALICMGYALIKSSVQKPFILFGIFWFLLYMAPTLFFEHRYAQWSYKYLEHRLVLSSVGLFLFLALICNDLFVKNKKVVLTSAAVLAGVFATYANVYVSIFSTPFTYYNRVIEVNRNDILARNNLASCYYDKGNIDSAIYEYTEALRSYPRFSLALGNRGKLYFNKKEYEKSISDLTAFTNLDTTDDNAYITLGNGYYALSKFDSTIKCYEKALRIKPNHYGYYFTIGVLRNNRQEYAMALPNFNKSIQNKPDNWESYANRGVSYYSLKMYDSALHDFNIYLSKVPNNGNAWNNMGLLKVNMGLKADACECFKKAAALGNANAVNYAKSYCN